MKFTNFIYKQSYDTKMGKKVVSEEKEVPKEIRDKNIDLIISGSYPEEGIATLGSNRGQLFVRIPRAISKRLDLKEGQKIFFRGYIDKERHKRLEVELQ